MVPATTCQPRHLRGRKGRKGVRLTSQDKKQEANQSAVPDIKHPTSKTPKAQFTNPIDHCIRKNIARARARSRERAPLPMVVFGTQQEIDEEDGDGGAGEDHDEVAEEEEAEHVVDFAEPHVVHDEVELNEDSAEGEDADEEHAGEGAEVSR